MVGKRGSGGTYRFRVSDAVEAPLRGYILRLRLLEGNPSIKELRPGRTLRLESPGGVGRSVRIKDHAVTGGRQSQERLDRLGELDIVISGEAARACGDVVGIGWTVSGPADGDERAA